MFILSILTWNTNEYRRTECHIYQIVAMIAFPSFIWVVFKYLPFLNNVIIVKTKISLPSDIGNISRYDYSV